MNLIDGIKSLFSRKTMSTDAWKRGGILSDYTSLNNGVTSPYSQSTIVYVACSTIAQNLPQAPLEFFTTNSNIKLGTEAPVVRLFNRPNETHTYFTFFEELTLFLALYGETFIWAGQSAGQLAGTSKLPAQLVVLQPTRMMHVIEDGRLMGWVYDTGQQRVPIDPKEVFQIKFTNPFNPIRGLAPIDAGRVDMDVDFLASQYSKAFFRNSANPAIAFTLPEDDESSKEQREEFMKEFNQLRQGATNFAKAMLMNPGMDIKKVGLTQEEMDYIKQREFSAERILAVYKVPPPMAGFYEQATYGNVRTAKKIFWNETIKTYARRYESALNNFFLPNFAPGITAKFNFSQIDELKHDAKETAELVNIYANHGIPMNVLNEAFELPWDPVEGLDIGYQPMTMLPVGTNFITLQQGTNGNNKDVINVTPKLLNDDEKLALEYYDAKVEEAYIKHYETDFSKNLHNYFYRQREKLLKKIAQNPDLVDNDFWKQENDRLMVKFDPIYEEMNQKFNKSRTTKELVSVNVFNRKLVTETIKKHKDDELLDKIRLIYGNFDKKLKNLDDSRVNLISKAETQVFSGTK